MGPPRHYPELDRPMEAARHVRPTDEEIAEQKISFAYGNAMSGRITKASVRAAAHGNRPCRD